MNKKTDFLNLFVESLSKTISFGETYKQGLSFITFSYKSEKGYLGSIIPTFTKNKNNSLKTLTAVSAKNASWWYTAWNSIYKAAHDEGKIDELEKEFIHILTTLKNKEEIWIIPFSAKSQVTLFFKLIAKKLQPYYSTSIQTINPLLGKINYCVLIKKGIPHPLILKIIGESVLKDFYLLKNKTEYKDDVPIIDAITKSLEQDQTTPDILDGLAKFFNEENIENLILNLFAHHTPFSTFTKLPAEEQATGIVEHDNVVNHVSPEEETPVEPTSTIADKSKVEQIPITTPKETQKIEPVVEPKSPEIKADGESVQTHTYFYDNQIEDKLPIGKSIVARDNKFKNKQSKLIETYSYQNIDVLKAINLYTGSNYRNMNRLLATDYIIKSIGNNSDLDFLSHKIYDKTELDKLLDKEKRNELLKEIDRIDLSDEKYLVDMSNIKSLLKLFTSPVAILSKDVTLFRGVPRFTRESVYNTELWLRNPTLDISKKTDGSFQKELKANLDGKSYSEKIKVLEHYYYMDKVLEIDPIFSTTIDPNIADTFSQKGHSLIIFAKKGSRAAYIKLFSNVRREEEVLLPPTSQFRLVDIKPKTETTFFFILEYLGPRENLDTVLNQKEIFWKNIRTLKSE